MNIIQVDFPKSNYFEEIYPKYQISIHHTVSNPKSAVGDIGSWKADPKRIATSSIIGYHGEINKCFSSKYYAHHLGITASFLQQLGYKDISTRNDCLNKHSIAIEIDSWGGLVLGDGKQVILNKKVIQTVKGKFYNAYGQTIDEDLEIEHIRFRGFDHFQRYSDAQIETLALVVSNLIKEYNIPKYGLFSQGFEVSKEALSGKPGVWSHSNYRTDKSDVYPDKRLLNLL